MRYYCYNSSGDLSNLLTWYQKVHWENRPNKNKFIGKIDRIKKIHWENRPIKKVHWENRPNKKKFIGKIDQIKKVHCDKFIAKMVSLKTSTLKKKVISNIYWIRFTRNVHSIYLNKTKKKHILNTMY